uniref:Putative secreted protein n=2 Tax=Anopheles triannulatus TaxID=58253 RepID=A0A2M4B017_9DIPT
MAISIFAVLLTAYFGLTGCSATLDETEASVVGPRRNTKSKESNTSARESAEVDDESVSSSDSDDDSSKGSKERLYIETLGQLKSAKLKSIENSLTDEQRKAEKEIERAQLAAIFELLKQQADSSNLDEEDLKEQLSLYR